MKTKTVSRLHKFLHWQYSGLIVVPVACALILGGWFYATGEMEFFDYWSCETLKNYVNDVDVPRNVTPHDELTVEQHVHLHELLNECQEHSRYSEPLKHLAP